MSAALKSFPVILALALAPAIARAGENPADLIEHGHWQRARALVEPRLAANPKDAEALWMLSQIRMAFGDNDAARKLAEQAVELEPRNARYHELLGEVYGQMAGQTGGLKALGLAKRFRKEAEIACSLDPAFVDPREALMEFYWRAPGIAGGGKDKARAMPEQIGRIDSLRGTLAKARLAMWEKDSSRAEGLIAQALERGATSYAARTQAAQFYAARRLWPELEREARAAQTLEPDRAEPFSLLAVTQARRQRWDDLDLTLARAEAAVPDNLGPYYQAAKALLGDGVELPRAERFLRKYLSREPEGFSPTHAHAHWRLAQVLEKQGRKPDAIAELETALRLKPDLDEAKKDLKRLR